jgi:hypothetical protein
MDEDDERSDIGYDDEEIDDDPYDDPDDRVNDWLDEVYAPGEHTVDLEPDPDFDPDEEINIDPQYDPPDPSDDGNSFTYEEGDERVDEWMDEIPDDAGSGEDPYTFQGDPYDNEEMDRFLVNQQMGPPSNYY